MISVQMYEEIKEEIESVLQQQAFLESELINTQKALEALKADTSELLDLLRGAKAAFKFFEFLAKLAKPVLFLGSAVAGWWLLLPALKRLILEMFK